MSRQQKPINYREIPFEFLINAARADVSIGAMARPYDEDEAKSSTEYLHRHNKNTLISLHEKRHYTKTVESKAITYNHLPITDFSIASPQQHEKFYRLLVAEAKHGHRVVIHCGAGNGRSGTMLTGVKLRQKLQQEFIEAKLGDKLTSLPIATVYPSDDPPIDCSKRLQCAVKEIRDAASSWGSGSFAVERVTDIASLDQYEQLLINKYNAYLRQLNSDPSGNIAVSVAIQYCDIEILDLLALRGHHPTFNQLKHTIQHNRNNNLVKLLIKRCPLDELNRSDSDKESLLIFAAKHGHTEALKTLIKYRCKTDMRDNTGKTAYDHARSYLIVETHQLIAKLQKYRRKRISATLSTAKANDPRDKILQQLIGKLMVCHGERISTEILNQIEGIVAKIQASQSSTSKVARLFGRKRSHFDDIAPSIRQLIQFARHGILALKARTPTVNATYHTPVQSGGGSSDSGEAPIDNEAEAPTDSETGAPSPR